MKVSYFILHAYEIHDKRIKYMIYFTNNSKSFTYYGLLVPEVYVYRKNIDTVYYSLNIGHRQCCNLNIT